MCWNRTLPRTLHLRRSLRRISVSLCRMVTLAFPICGRTCRVSLKSAAFTANPQNHCPRWVIWWQLFASEHNCNSFLLTVSGGLCEWCRRGRFCLRVHGHFRSDREYATATAEDSGRCFCETGSISCAVEIRGNTGRLRVAAQCQDRTMVAATGYFG